MKSFTLASVQMCNSLSVKKEPPPSGLLSHPILPLLFPVFLDLEPIKTSILRASGTSNRWRAIASSMAAPTRCKCFGQCIHE